MDYHGFFAQSMHVQLVGNILFIVILKHSDTIIKDETEMMYAMKRMHRSTSSLLISLKSRIKHIHNIFISRNGLKI